jgi:adenosylcobinamide kinase/adenosylcobinamide-phosphate guanylyltransferase
MKTSTRWIAYIGGIRSGKSEAAEARVAWEARTTGLRVGYLGTVDEGRADQALSGRVREHRARRPKGWLTLDAGTGLAAAARQALGKGCGILFADGLGLWVAGNMEPGEKALLREWKKFTATAKGSRLCVLVLDEVGQGGVPGHAVARDFADLNGRLNQAAATLCDEVWMVQAGLLRKLK